MEESSEETLSLALSSIDSFAMSQMDKRVVDGNSSEELLEVYDEYCNRFYGLDCVEEINKYNPKYLVLDNDDDHLKDCEENQGKLIESLVEKLLNGFDTNLVSYYDTVEGYKQHSQKGLFNGGLLYYIVKSLFKKVDCTIQVLINQLEWVEICTLKELTQLVEYQYEQQKLKSTSSSCFLSGIRVHFFDAQNSVVNCFFIETVYPTTVDMLSQIERLATKLHVDWKSNEYYYNLYQTYLNKDSSSSVRGKGKDVEDDDEDLVNELLSNWFLKLKSSLVLLPTTMNGGSGLLLKQNVLKMVRYSIIRYSCFQVGIKSLQHLSPKLISVENPIKIASEKLQREQIKHEKERIRSELLEEYEMKLKLQNEKQFAEKTKIIVNVLSTTFVAQFIAVGVEKTCTKLRNQALQNIWKRAIGKQKLETRKCNDTITQLNSTCEALRLQRDTAMQHLLNANKSIENEREKVLQTKRLLKERENERNRLQSDLNMATLQLKSLCIENCSSPKQQKQYNSGKISPKSPRGRRSPISKIPTIKIISNTCCDDETSRTQEEEEAKSNNYNNDGEIYDVINSLVDWKSQCEYWKSKAIKQQLKLVPPPSDDLLFNQNASQKLKHVEEQIFKHNNEIVCCTLSEVPQIQNNHPSPKVEEQKIVEAYKNPKKTTDHREEKEEDEGKKQEAQEQEKVEHDEEKYRDQVETLKQELSNLKISHQASKSIKRFEKMKREHGVLEKQVREQVKQIDLLKRLNGQFQKQLQNRKSQVEKYTKQFDSQTLCIQGKDEMICHLEQQFNDVKKQLSLLKLERKNEKYELQLKSKKVESLEQTVKDQTDELVQLRKECNLLRSWKQQSTKILIQNTKKVALLEAKLQKFQQKESMKFHNDMDRIFQIKRIVNIYLNEELSDLQQKKRFMEILSSEKEASQTQVVELKSKLQKLLEDYETLTKKMLDQEELTKEANELLADAEVCIKVQQNEIRNFRLSIPSLSSNASSNNVLSLVEQQEQQQQQTYSSSTLSPPESPNRRFGNLIISPYTGEKVNNDMKSAFSSQISSTSNATKSYQKMRGKWSMDDSVAQNIKNLEARLNDKSSTVRSQRALLRVVTNEATSLKKECRSLKTRLIRTKVAYGASLLAMEKSNCKLLDHIAQSEMEDEKLNLEIERLQTDMNLLRAKMKTQFECESKDVEAQIDALKHDLIEAKEKIQLLQLVKEKERLNKEKMIEQYKMLLEKERLETKNIHSKLVVLNKKYQSHVENMRIKSISQLVEQHIEIIPSSNTLKQQKVENIWSDLKITFKSLEPYLKIK